MRKNFDIFLSSVSWGLLVVISFPPISFWPLLIVALLGMNLSLLGQMKEGNFLGRKVFLSVFVFSLTYNFGGFYWLSHTLHEFGGLATPLSVVAAFATFAILAFQTATGLLIFSWILNSFRKKGIFSRNSLTLNTSLVFGFFVVEILEYKVFPWRFVQALGSDSYLLSATYYLKTDGWSFALAFVLWGLSYFAVKIKEEIQNLGRFKFSFALNVFVSILCFSFSVFYSVGLLSRKNLKKIYKEAKPVALIQGNVGNYEKKLAKSGAAPTIENVLKLHEPLIEEAALRFAEIQDEKKKEAWVFWPETSFPTFPLNPSRWTEILDSWIQLTGGFHILGTYENAPSTWGGLTEDVDFNIAMMIDAKKGFQGRYQKMMRVPFGEFVPLEDLMPNIYSKFPGLVHFGKGKEFTLLPHPSQLGPVFIPLICYEILFSDLIKDFINQAQKKYPGRELILLNLTNDSWYGDSSEPFLHSALARWQAAQFGLPLLRPTNTGLSQVIAPWGEVLAQGPRNESALVWGELPLKN